MNPIRPRPGLSAASLLCSLSALSALGVPTPSPAQGAPGPERLAFAAGTAYETPYLRVDTGEEGPAVLLVGALGPADPERAAYLEEVAQWTFRAGSVVVVPGFTTPAEDHRQDRLSRAFPAERGENPVAPAAAALWEFVREISPDLLVQLSGSREPRSRSGASWGNTLFATGSPAVINTGEAMIEAAGRLAPGEDFRWLRMRSPARNSLVRSVSDVLGIDTVILYPASAAGREVQRAQSDAALAALFLRYGMMDVESAPPEARIPAPPDHAALGEGLLRVALFKASGVGGSGIPNITGALEARGGVYAAVVDDAEIRAGVLRDFDVAVFSGGSGSRQAASLGEEGRREVVEFVRRGGGYLGVCAGAYLACANYSWGLGLINARTKSTRWRRGRGQVELELTAAGREVLGGPGGRFEVRYANGPVIEPADAEGLPPFETWAWFRTELAENDTPAGIMVDSPAFAAAEFGKGRVAIYSPHPESSEELHHTVTLAVDWLAQRR